MKKPAQLILLSLFLFAGSAGHSLPTERELEPHYPHHRRDSLPAERSTATPGYVWTQRHKSFIFSFSGKTGKLIWGAGPTFLLPTATDDVLGTGPSTRSDVNSMTLQYFVNYNLKKGYYLTIQPIITANWNAPSGNVWLVPFGGGIGRIMRLGFQPVNLSAQAYLNAKRPDVLPAPT